MQPTHQQTRCNQPTHKQGCNQPHKQGATHKLRRSKSQMFIDFFLKTRTIDFVLEIWVKFSNPNSKLEFSFSCGKVNFQLWVQSFKFRFCRKKNFKVWREGGGKVQRVPPPTTPPPPPLPHPTTTQSPPPPAPNFHQRNSTSIFW